MRPPSAEPSALSAGEGIVAAAINFAFRRVTRLGAGAALASGRQLGLLRPARAQNQYATHLPILIGLARMVPVRRVLELGCGNHSTFTFLDRRAFPDLITLESLETDAAWARHIAEENRREPRLNLRLVEDPLETVLRQLPLNAYDLLLVDHSDKYEIRAATISFLANCAPGRTLVMLHDYEIPLYRRAARGFRHRFEFTAFTPSTCLACGHSPVRRGALRSLERAIKRHARTLRPDDAAAWIAVLDDEFGAARPASGQEPLCACSSSHP